MLKIDKDKCSNYFKDDVSGSIQYLKALGIKSNDYLSFLKETHGGYVEDNHLIINGEEYSVEMFFGESDESIYDIRKNNKMMKINNKKFVAIANLYGDDLLGMVPDDDGIYFCRLDDISLLLLIKISESFEDLMKMIEKEKK